MNQEGRYTSIDSEGRYLSRNGRERLISDVGIFFVGSGIGAWIIITAKLLVWTAKHAGLIQ